MTCVYFHLVRERPREGVVSRQTSAEKELPTSVTIRARTDQGLDDSVSLPKSLEARDLVEGQ